MDRPNILDIQTGEELKKWYWLKDELVNFAKSTDTIYVGSKFEILERLANKLDGKKEQVENKNTAISKFNWKTKKLTLDTIITDSYKNSENTRKFFKEYCGQKFAFSISFYGMDETECWQNVTRRNQRMGENSEVTKGQII